MLNARFLCTRFRLYNKESVLELLLDRSKFDEGGSKFDHLRSLKVTACDCKTHSDWLLERNSNVVGGSVYICYDSSQGCGVIALFSLSLARCLLGFYH